jgi:hypothetical protein
MMLFTPPDPEDVVSDAQVRTIQLYKFLIAEDHTDHKTVYRIET